MLLLVPSPELITCFVEGNTANFSLMGPCVGSKGCSLDDREKHFGSHLTAGPAVAGKGICATTWQTCRPGYVGWPHIVWPRTGLGMWQEPSLAGGNNPVPSVCVPRSPCSSAGPPCVSHAHKSPLCYPTPCTKVGRRSGGGSSY